MVSERILNGKRQTAAASAGARTRAAFVSERRLTAAVGFPD